MNFPEYVAIIIAAAIPFLMSNPLLSYSLVLGSVLAFVMLKKVWLFLVKKLSFHIYLFFGVLFLFEAYVAMQSATLVVFSLGVLLVLFGGYYLTKCAELFRTIYTTKSNHTSTI